MTVKAVRKLGCITLAVCTLAAAPLYADDAATGADTAPILLAQEAYGPTVMLLESAGYNVLEIRRTFLGRFRIIASNEEHIREVIVSRSTGEVLNDRITGAVGAGPGKSKAHQATMGSGNAASAKSGGSANRASARGSSGSKSGSNSGGNGGGNGGGSGGSGGGKGSR